MTTYSLTQPLPSLRDRGYLQSGVSPYACTVCMFESGDDTHVLVTFMAQNTGFHHVNMSTGDHHIATATGDYGGGFSVFVLDAPNNMLYCLSHYGQGFLYKYNISSGAMTQIAHETWPGQYAMCKGSDNKIWVGWSEIGGYVSSYDPSNDTYVNTWGPCDPVDCQYIQTIFADSSYVYCGMRPAVSDDGYYLARITKSNNSVTLYFKGEGGSTCNVLALADGTPYIERRDSTNTMRYYSVPNIDEVSNPGSLSAFPYQQCKFDGPNSPQAWEPQYGYEVNIDYYLPIEEDQEYSEISYRTPVGSGDFIPVQTTYTGPWRSEPDMVVLPLGNNQIASICGTDKLVEYVNFNYDTNAFGNSYQALLSAYDAKLHPSGDIYIFGYSAAVMRYNPANPWTFVYSKYHTYLDSDSTKPNPYEITTSITQQQYSFRGDYDKNNVVWFCTNETRDGNDYGKVIWYDPSDGSSGGATDLNTILDAGNSKLRDIVTTNNRSKIVVSSQDGKLYVVDADTMDLEGTAITPTQNTNMFHAMMEAESGYLLLASIYIDPDTGPDGTGNLNYFQKINVATGATVWSRSFGISGGPFGIDGGNSSQRYTWYLRKGLDNWAWMFIGDSLYRIDPTPNNGTVSKVVDVTAGRIIWSGVDLIVYGKTHFFYYPGILTLSDGYSMGSYTSLPTTTDDLTSIYTSNEVSQVTSNDNIRVSQSGLSNYVIHQFVQQAAGNDVEANIACNLQTTIAPSQSNVVLEVYDTNSDIWVEVDREVNAAADTDFDLAFNLTSGSTPTFENSKDNLGVITSRIWQHAE